MRRSAWGGNPPKDEAAARERIVEAALRAIRRDGLENTSVSSIAREAEITRQTFYRYFADGQEVVRTVELRSGGGLIGRLAEHVRSFDRLDERLAESIVFLLEELPNDPLAFRGFQPGYGTIINDTNLAYTARYLEAIWTDDYAPLAKANGRALAELLLRLLRSLVLMPHEGRAMKSFVNDHVRPCIMGWLECHARR